MICLGYKNSARQNLEMPLKELTLSQNHNKGLIASQHIVFLSLFSIRNFMHRFLHKISEKGIGATIAQIQDIEIRLEKSLIEIQYRYIPNFSANKKPLVNYQTSTF
jgi:hypothetical protein